MSWKRLGRVRAVAAADELGQCASTTTKMNPAAAGFIYRRIPLALRRR
jgi:hypothetical protein